MKTVTVAVIGAGFAGNFHCNAYKKVNTVQVRLKTIVDNQAERAKLLQDRWGFEVATDDYESVLADPEIDLIDITLPPVLHIPYAVRALKAGKHVACEKPLTGYFGKPEDVAPIGLTVSKRKMFETLMTEMEEVKQAVAESNAQFMYAENYVYSPAVVKAAEILRHRKTRVVYSIGECSIHGSTSVLSGEWKNVGGGTLMRLGSHPIAGILYLKQVEAEAHGETVYVKSVTCDIGQICTGLTEEERKHLRAKPIDVEDFATITLTFSDGSKSIIYCNDNTMGGIHNVIKLYGNDGVVECNMTPANNMMTYFADQKGLEDVYISECLDQKTGWNNVFVAEETLRGYTQELTEFAECAAENRHAESDFKLAYDTVRIMYAGYLSAEEGRRVEFDEGGNIL